MAKKISKSVFFGGAAIVTVLVYLGVFFVSGISSDYSTDKYLAKKNDKLTENSVVLDLDVKSVDLENNSVDIAATPRLYGDIGYPMGNGSYVGVPLDFVFDAYSEQTRWSPTAGDIQAGMGLSLRLNGDIKSYPFDQYSATLYSMVSQRETASTVRIPLFLSDTQEQVPGLHITSKQTTVLNEKTSPATVKEDSDNGVGSAEWNISRSNGAILTVILLGALMLTGAIVSILITIAILRGKRPPSINSLGWLAAFLFAFFSVRSALPGNPPSGVLFDVVIFYPVVLILVLLIAVTVTSWILRDDWDLENPVYAIRGEFPLKKKQD